MQGPALLSNHVFIVIVNIIQGSILWLNYVFSCEDEHNVQVIGQRFGWVEYAVETAGGRYVKGSWVKSVFVMAESVSDAFTKSAQRLMIRPFSFDFFLYKTISFVVGCFGKGIFLTENVHLVACVLLIRRI